MRQLIRVQVPAWAPPPTRPMRRTRQSRAAFPFLARKAAARWIEPATLPPRHHGIVPSAIRTRHRDPGARRRPGCCRAPGLDRLAEGHRRRRRVRLPHRRAVPAHQLGGFERRAQHRPERAGRVRLPLRDAADVPPDRSHRLAFAGAAAALRLRDGARSPPSPAAGRRHRDPHSAAVVAGGRHRAGRREPVEHDCLVLWRDAVRADVTLVRRLRHAPVVHRLPVRLLHPLPAAACRAAAPRRRAPARPAGRPTEGGPASAPVRAHPRQPTGCCGSRLRSIGTGPTSRCGSGSTSSA